MKFYSLIYTIYQILLRELQFFKKRRNWHPFLILKEHICINILSNNLKKHTPFWWLTVKPFIWANWLIENSQNWLHVLLHIEMVTWLSLLSTLFTAKRIYEMKTASKITNTWTEHNADRKGQLRLFHDTIGIVNFQLSQIKPKPAARKCREVARVAAWFRFVCVRVRLLRG